MRKSEAMASDFISGEKTSRNLPALSKANICAEWSTVYASPAFAEFALA
jgi:hypothetical protein